METKKYPVLIVGAGIAGLRCGQILQSRGIESLILEKDTQPGGRIRTIRKNGFILDAGFQVLLDSYEEVQQAISFLDLNAKTFDSGALVANGSRKTKYAFHPFIHPEKLISTAFQFPGSVADMLKMGNLAWNNRIANPDFWKNINPESTQSLLKKLGFSKHFYDGFLRPFFGGVFLDPELGLPKGYFTWLMAKFFTGRATLPENGMQSLPLEMQKTAGPIRFETKVKQMDEGVITLENGEVLEAEWVVDARPFQGMENWENAKGTNTIYLQGPAQKNLPKCLILNGNPKSGILHFCFPSAIQASYAPEGKSLCSLTLSGELPSTAIEDWLIPELIALYPQINWPGFSWLETFTIPNALPAFPLKNDQPFKRNGRILQIGDYCAYPSINAALRSGREAGEWIWKNP